MSCSLHRRETNTAHHLRREKEKRWRGDTFSKAESPQDTLLVLHVEALRQTSLTKIPEHTFCSLIQLPHQLEVPLQLARQVFNTWKVKAKKYYSLFSS